jgi:hypothetical protein
MIIFLQLEENEQNKEKERENEYYFSGERAGCLVSWSVCRCCNCSLLHRTTKKRNANKYLFFYIFRSPEIKYHLPAKIRQHLGVCEREKFWIFKKLQTARVIFVFVY